MLNHHRMTRSLYIIFLFAFSLIIVAGAQAQNGAAVINVTASPSRVFIGEPVEVKVSVQMPANMPLQQLYNLPDTFNTLEVIQRGTLDSSFNASIKSYSQSFTVTGFDSGSCVVPPLLVKAGDKNYQSRPVEIMIVPVPIAADSSYHDIREIVEVTVPAAPWWYWAAAVVSVLIIGILIYYWIRSRRKKVEGEIYEPDKGALDEALQQLKQLQQQALPEKQEWKAYYSALTEIVKVFIEKRFGKKATSYTTEELSLFADAVLPKEKATRFVQSLRVADAVKFARYQPEITQTSEDMKNMEDSVRAMDHKKD